MSFLDHITRCNAYDLSKFVPLIADGKSPAVFEGIVWFISNSFPTFSACLTQPCGWRTAGNV